MLFVTSVKLKNIATASVTVGFAIVVTVIVVVGVWRCGHDGGLDCDRGLVSMVGCRSARARAGAAGAD